MKKTQIVFLTVVVLLSAVRLRAGIDPINARGFSPNKVYAFNGIDAVNTFNGNLTLNIPLGQEYQVGDGLRYQLHLTYNSTIWDQEEINLITAVPWGGYIDPMQSVAGPNSFIESVPGRFFNAGIGWHVTFGELRRAEMESNQWRYSYVSPDGASHFFYDQLHWGDHNVDPKVSYTRDGSYIRMTRSDDGSTRTVELPDGTKNLFVCAQRCGDTFYKEFELREIRDARGNVLTFTYTTDADGSHRTWKLTESNNPTRYHELTFERSWLQYAQSGRQNEWRLQKVDLAGFPDAQGTVRRAVYEFQYTKGRLHREGSQTIFWSTYNPDKSYVPWIRENSVDDFSIEVDLLTRVKTPESTVVWEFAYYKNGEGDPLQYKTTQDSTGRHPWSDISGRLSKVTLPTKGTIAYEYRRRPFPKRNCNESEPGPGIPSPPAKGHFTHNIGIWKRSEGTATTYYLSWPREPFVDPQDPCKTAKDFMAAVIDPMGATNISYYSIALNEEEENSWKTYEYGMPFTRASSVDGLFLSKQVFQCPADYMADPAPNSPLTYADSRTRAKAILAEPPEGPACGAPRRSTYVQYEYSEVVCNGDYSGPDCIQSNQRVRKERTVFHDDVENAAATYTQTDYDDFDGLSRFRFAKTSGTFAAANFASDVPNDTATRFSDYNPPGGVIADNQPWLVNTLDDEIVFDHQNAAQSRVLYQYDPTGVLLARRTLADPTKLPGATTYKLSSNDLLVKYERTVSGDAIRLTERYYGGDKHATSGGTDLGTAGVSDNGSALEQYQMFRTTQYGAEVSSEYRTASGTRFLLIAANTVDPNTGLVSATADASGLTTTMNYDLLGRITKIAPGEQDSIGYRYPFTGSTAQVEITRPARVQTTDAAKYEILLQYDGFGRIINEQRLLPSGDKSEKQITYWPNGLKYLESTVRKAGTIKLADPIWTTYMDYDAFGRVGKIKRPDTPTADDATVITDFAYFGIRKTKVVERVGSYRASSGSVRKSDVTTWSHLDQYGRLVKVVEESGANAKLPGEEPQFATSPTRYDYDAAGHLVKVTQGEPSGAKQIRSFFYDKRGLLTSETLPEVTPAINYSEFDAMGQYRRRIYGAVAATALNYERDRASRLTAVNLQNGVTLKSYLYHDDNADRCNRQGRMAGKLEEASRFNWVPDPNKIGDRRPIRVTQYYSYDAKGEVQSLTTSASGRYESAPAPWQVSFETGYTYDELANVKSITYPSCAGCTGIAPAPPSRTQTYVYSNGSVTQVPGFATSVSYHPNGLIHMVAHAGSKTVTDVTEISSNDLARPHAMYTTGATINWNPDSASRAFRYDGADNIIGIGADSFVYDGAKRLTEGCVGQRKQAFSYDIWGNLTTIKSYANCTATTPLTTLSLQPSAATNRLPESSKIHYSNTGNLLQLNNDLYEYDEFNMMSHAHSQIVNASSPGLGKIFLYDADDERVAVIDYRVPPDDPADADSTWRTRWTWSIRGASHKVLRDFEQTRPEGALDGPWSWGGDYIYFGERLLATVDVSGTRRLHTDHLGTPRLVTNDAGETLALHTYFPFGEEISAPDTDPDRMRFTGHERDNNDTRPNAQDGDLDYMHARYYTPAMGRFLSVDPIIGKTDHPQSWNRYSYVNNNPLGFNDPTGMARSGAESTEQERQRAAAAEAKRRQMKEARQTSASQQVEGLQGGGMNPSGKAELHSKAPLLNPRTGRPMTVNEDAPEDIANFVDGFAQGIQGRPIGRAVLSMVGLRDDEMKRKESLIDQDGNAHVVGEGVGITTLFVVAPHAQLKPPPPAAAVITTGEDGRLVIQVGKWINKP
jgi:RHS repeat-associated protein